MERENVGTIKDMDESSLLCDPVPTFITQAESKVRGVGWGTNCQLFVGLNPLSRFSAALMPLCLELSLLKAEMFLFPETDSCMPASLIPPSSHTFPLSLFFSVPLSLSSLLFILLTFSPLQQSDFLPQKSVLTLWASPQAFSFSSRFCIALIVVILIVKTGARRRSSWGS